MKDFAQQVAIHSTPLLFWLNAISNLAIGIAYFSFPLILFIFSRHRREIKLFPLYLAFGSFLFLCGLGHIFDVVALWTPIAGPETLMKLSTALFSIVAVFGMWKFMPYLMRYPSIALLEQKNSALAEANRRFEGVVTAVQIGIFERVKTDNGKDRLYWSPRIYELLNLSPQLSPSFELFISLVHPEDRQKILDNVAKDLSESPDSFFEFRVQIAGTYRWFRSVRLVERDSEGTVHRVTGTLEDIHNLKIGEQHLLESRNSLKDEVDRRTHELQKANEAKNRFLANMSHEMRTPVSLILGFTDQLREQERQLSPAGQGYLNVIYENGKMLHRIINDLLDLSQAEAGRLDFLYEDVSLLHLTTETIHSFEEAYRQKGIELNFESTIETKTLISTDAIRLQQVFYNLLANSLKYTQEGEVKVSLQNQASDPALYSFEVIDSGVGIKSGDHERIFGEFTRSDTSRFLKTMGSGLGLKVARTLARNLGGDVTLVSSIPGSGSHFRFTFKSQPEKKKQKAIVEKTLHAISPQTLSVYVVDDNEDNLKLSKLLLDKVGCRSRLYENPLEFITACVQDQPDFVLVDIQMPLLDGIQVYHQLREKGYKGHIVALTAYALRDDIDEILNVGFEEYILKPLNLKSLSDLLNPERKRGGEVHVQ